MSGTQRSRACFVLYLLEFWMTLAVTPTDKRNGPYINY